MWNFVFEGLGIGVIHLDVVAADGFRCFHYGCFRKRFLDDGGFLAVRPVLA